MFRTNRLIEKLARDEPCFGAWLFMGSPVVAEVLGGAGLDALIIDLEHTPCTIETAVEQMRAIRAAGSATVLARLGSNDPAQIKLLLDAGVEGLLLPTAESAEDVRQFVESCLYPPKGKRGAHFTVSRAAAWGARSIDYFENIESELLLIAMIESAAGVAAIPEMAGVDGLSMLFTGPLDLSGSINKMGRWSDPDVIALIRRAEELSVKSGRLLGGAMIPDESALECVARGHRFITVGSDVGMLRSGAKLSFPSCAK